MWMDKKSKSHLKVILPIFQSPQSPSTEVDDDDDFLSSYAEDFESDDPTADDLLPPAA